MDDVANREMLEAGACLTLMIGAAVWQVLRTLSRGGLDGMGVIKLTCNLVVLGIVVYVGYTALTLWT
jgi:hypothetical protein